MKKIVICMGLLGIGASINASDDWHAMKLEHEQEQKAVNSVMSGLEVLSQLSENEQEKYIESKEEQLDVLEKIAKKKLQEETAGGQMASESLERIQEAKTALQAIKHSPHGKPTVPPRPRRRPGRRAAGRQQAVVTMSPHGKPTVPAKR